MLVPVSVTVSLFVSVSVSQFLYSVCMNLFVPVSVGVCVNSEGRPVMYDAFSLSGIAKLSFDSPFLSPLLFFCLVLLISLSCHFF